MSSPKIYRLKTQYDVTDYRGESDVILGFYLFSLGDDIFRKLESIESNQSFYTTLMYIDPFKLNFKSSTELLDYFIQDS